MASTRRPPIHPNCRCTLVPYVELKDEEGNVVDIENERPAANADFDQLAKDVYNQKAKEKGWKRRFEDLSPSTRLKYYYQAQKDYEKETGKPAYRQVDSALSFPEYFKQQPDSFKRAWLGAKRYEAYKDGKLTEKAIFAPDLGYTISPTSLVKFVEPDVPEELDKLIKEYKKKEEINVENNTSISGRTRRQEKDDWGVSETENEKAFFSAKETEEEIARAKIFDRMFPLKPQSDNIDYARQLAPKRKHFKNPEYRLIASAGTRKGLNAVAQMCDYYGIDFKEVGNLTFDRELNDRPKYYPVDNKIVLDQCDSVDGEFGSSISAIHEIAHAIDKKCFSGFLTEEIVAFYDDISLRNEKGEVQYESYIDDEDKCRFRVLKIKIPDNYAAKEYLNSRGDLESTEFLSMFFQVLFSNPLLRYDPDFKDFFEGIENCIERARKRALQNNGIH